MIFLSFSSSEELLLQELLEEELWVGRGRMRGGLAIGLGLLDFLKKGVETTCLESSASSLLEDDDELFTSWLPLGKSKLGLLDLQFGMGNFLFFKACSSSELDEEETFRCFFKACSVTIEDFIGLLLLGLLRDVNISGLDKSSSLLDELLSIFFTSLTSRLELLDRPNFGRWNFLFFFSPSSSSLLDDDDDVGSFCSTAVTPIFSALLLLAR